MKILGLDGVTGSELDDELRRGAKFVIYQYTISVLILTFRRPTDIYFIRSGRSSVTPGLGFSLLTFAMGWWGIPWGPIYSIGTLVTNFGGGKDVTAEVVRMFQQQSAPAQPPPLRPM